jgi:hypothetical protein
MKNNNRRKFLKNTGIAIGSGIGYLSLENLFNQYAQNVSLNPTHNKAKANETKNNFMLYIHCGSWDGIAAGLLQPQNTAGWPDGVFVRNKPHILGTLDPTETAQGKQVMQGNPLLAKFTQSNGHIFHHYNSPLAEISQHLFHATCNPGSLDHNVARVIQKCGKPTGYPHWIAGASQAFLSAKTNDPSAVAQVIGTQLVSNRTPSISSVMTTSLESYRKEFSEPVSVNAGLPNQIRDMFAKASLARYSEHYGPGLVPNGYASAFKNSINGMIYGIPRIQETDAAILNLRTIFSKDAILKKISSHFGDNDTEAILVEPSIESLRQQFILAGALSSSGAASGMEISLPGEDRHFGGSQLNTSRLSAVLWTQLSIFWKWAIENGLDKNITVIATHEFSRTPWNTTQYSGEATINGIKTTISSPGTDHHNVNGVYILNGNLNKKGKYGAIANGYVAQGSAALNTVPSASIAAPTTLQVVGTMLMSIYPEFRQADQPYSARKIREYWSDFKDEDIIKALA